MATLWDRIEELRMNGGEGGRHLTYEEFAKRVNSVKIDGAATLTKSTITDIKERGRQPGYKTIISIAKAFDVGTDYLLGISDIRKTASDDINIAAETTGLNIDAIKQLIYLKGTENSNVITDAIGDLVADAACHISASGWDGNKYPDEWETPDTPAGSQCFLSDYYNLIHAKLLYEGKERADRAQVELHPVDFQADSIILLRDHWLTYYSNRLQQYIMTTANDLRKALFERVGKAQIERGRELKNKGDEEKPAAKPKRKKNSTNIQKGGDRKT